MATGKTGDKIPGHRDAELVDEVRVSGVVEVSVTARVPEDATKQEVRRALSLAAGSSALQAYISDTGDVEFDD